MQKLYYCSDEREFYLVNDTTTQLHINRIADETRDEYYVESPVYRSSNLIVSKHGKGKHFLKSYDKNHILIYPAHETLPFYLEPATIGDIVQEIEHRKKSGRSLEYFERLKELL